MKTCIVCGNQMPEDEMVCGRCGFPAEQRYFLSEKHCRAWQHEIVEPARLSWQRQELERQRRELEMQKRLFAEQRESLKRGKPDIDTANSGWNTDTGKKEKPKKDQQPKKKGDMVKNTLIAFAVFAAAGLIGRAVIAPSSSPSSASFGETQQHIEASIDAETEPVTLSQEQLDKAAEVGFDLNLFENLPLTSREDILAWLDENKYQYKESSGESNWTVDIRTDEGSQVMVSYKGQTAGTQANYTLHYYYHEEYQEDETYFNTVKQLMKELHEEGSVQEDYASYYDNAEDYIVLKVVASKTVLRKAKQSEINEQTEQLVRMLNEMPEIKEKQETLDWIAENSDSYEDAPEYSWCTVDLGIWNATYFYEDFWYFELYHGNAKKYYEIVCEKFKEAGYIVGLETVQDNSREIYCTIPRKCSIDIEYSPMYHRLELYCNPL